MNHGWERTKTERACEEEIITFSARMCSIALLTDLLSLQQNLAASAKSTDASRAGRTEVAFEDSWFRDSLLETELRVTRVMTRNGATR